MPKVHWTITVSIGLLGLLGADSCHQSMTDTTRPEASLATSADAQQAFRSLRATWFAGSTAERRRLEGPLRAFLARFPRDEQSDMVRVLIGFDCVSDGSLQEGRSFFASVRERVGSVQDFAQVGEAYALLRERRPEDAWSRLEPLAGKIVDSDERLIFSELRLRAAIDAHRFQRAVLAAEELLTEASPEARPSLEQLVSSLFQGAPKLDLRASLQSFERDEPDDGVTAPARHWLRKLLRQRLVELAVRERDAVLARQLLDTAPAALRTSDDGARLAEIASGGESAPLILGRSVGVVLSLGSVELRRRSANLAAGLALGLGLPDTLSKPASVHLISEEDDGTAAGTLEAMRELSAAGAAILVAGLDAESADTAALFSEENGIPVLLIQQPASVAPPYHDAFQIGENRADEQAAIDAELTRRKLQRIARVGRAGEPCDVLAPNVLAPRFSVAEWRRERISAVLVLGPSSCAREVAREMREIRFLPVLALGLESAEFIYTSQAPEQSFALGAGSFPNPTRPGLPGNSALPPLDWYAALGRDAALLSKAALDDFPDGRVDDIRAVHELHARAGRALATAQAALWTSDARGFAPDHLLPRSLKIVPSESSRKVP